MDAIVKAHEGDVQMIDTSYQSCTCISRAPRQKMGIEIAVWVARAAVSRPKSIALVDKEGRPLKQPVDEVIVA